MDLQAAGSTSEEEEFDYTDKQIVQPHTNIPFPPLPIDIVRTMCEFAALDERTAQRLYVSSKDIREWVAPFRFQSIEIHNHRSLMRLQNPEILGSIAPHVFTISLQPDFGDACTGGPTRMALDLKNLLDALPNLAHFHWPVLVSRSMWKNVAIMLPAWVFYLEIGQYYIQDSHDAVLPSTGHHITHIVSNLLDPFRLDIFTKWPALTHLCFEIHNSDRQWGRSIANCTFPITAFPPTIISCILIDGQSDAWRFRWSIDNALVDLVLGDTDSRIVFAVYEKRETWMISGHKAVTSNPNLSWIREGLQDAILYHGRWQEPNETIWAKVNPVVRRRRDPEVRKAVSSLLNRKHGN
ncbi:hypothetical protein DL96DRAFT_1617242 [Flagelloscypha sp. PMI_526]|nr:hypothetical protein DL96DRAFT_1617242 [Flagelloscypha sp. PMI_526]